MPPARYVVLPHYEAKLKQLLEVANDVDGGLPLEYEVTCLQVRGRGGCQIRLVVLLHNPSSSRPHNGDEQGCATVVAVR